ncbi:hypothetical protein BU16DRAFT_598437 [Lophium mytilinum]|uniref:gamma-glutamylcyclotransferase n=1 Tax=Lophium mytilinum TaxID=390894 RepID=A0A6A6QB65_9PEZI|nr:hypothetical protein BU16DRAFT_598437 [Lophium mytilinum]
MPTTTTTTDSSSPTLYFGYGSNLWQHQMRLRCPTSRYLGVARLPNWRWIINTRGYANVVEVSPSKSTPASQNLTSTPPATAQKHADEVYGLVYALLPADEARLDVNEGVPEAYGKEVREVEFWGRGGDADSPGWTDVRKKAVKKGMLVYVDRKRLGEAKPKKEYVHRMNRGIADALAMGVPGGYVEGVLRGFIPEEKEEGGGEEEAKALRQAVKSCGRGYVGGFSHLIEPAPLVPCFDSLFLWPRPTRPLSPRPWMTTSSRSVSNTKPAQAVPHTIPSQPASYPLVNPSVKVCMRKDITQLAGNAVATTGYATATGSYAALILDGWEY